MFNRRRSGTSLFLAILAFAWSSAAMAAPMIIVCDAWLRPAPAGAGGAAYLTITNRAGVADTLVAVSSPDAAHASSRKPDDRAGDDHARRAQSGDQSRR